MRTLNTLLAGTAAGGLLALALSACTPTPHTEDTASADWPVARSPFDAARSAAVRKQAQTILQKMTLEQKVGQMTQAELNSITPEQVKEFQVGSVLVGGGAFLNNNKHATTQAWLETIDQYQAAAVAGSGIPLLWGVDAVHGHNKIYGATLFPHNIGLGAANNPTLVQEISAVTARQVMATGMDWTFAPSVSVVRDDRWGRTYESFAETPEISARLGKASILGFQGQPGTNLLGRGHIVATAKHFIGDGGTDKGIDRGDTKVSEQELASIHAPAYAAAIEAGVLTIMASHNSWQGVRLHGHEYLLNQVLKQQMGFEGFVIGDWNSHALVDGCTNDHCPQAVNAGVDMLMVPNDWQAFIANTVADVKAGRIPQQRIDDAVLRILQVKIRAGLLEHPVPSQRPLAGRSDLLNNTEVQNLAAQAVRESAVLLKNNNNLLPLKPNQTVLVAGEGAHNIPMQTGGWTLSWQSTDITNEDFPNGSSIFEGIKEQVSAAGGRAVLSPDGSYQTKPDVAVVVFGEMPYAEWQGDLPHLAWQAKNPEAARLLEQLQADGIKTVSVFLSGRPLWMNRELNASDAFIAAWLPGTEGKALAPLLFSDGHGNAAYDFTGRLPFSWPATPTQSPLNAGDANYQPLFAVGYGLDYTTEKTIPRLAAEFSATELTTNDAEPLFDGTPVAPWEVHLQRAEANTVRYLSGLAESGPLTVIEADKDTQGDSLGLRFDGFGQALLTLFNPGAFRDFTGWLERDAAVVFDARLLQASDSPVYAQMACFGDNCQGKVDITTLVNTSPLNDWNSLSVALSCFAEQGLDMTAIRHAFGISTRGALELDITNIRIEPGMRDKAGVSCP